jgi:tetratricopeptide (TPR) repeat protein
MAGSYHSLGYMDSLAICIQECLPLTDYIRETDKAYLYTRIGEFYAESEPEMAKKYLLKAIDIYPQLWTYLALSNIYLKENNQEKAQEIWTKALQTKGTTKAKIDILIAMRQQSMEQKDFMQANALADSILKTQERFYEGQREDQIAEIQAKYDKETAVRDLREKYMTWGLGLLALTTIIVTFLGYKSRQGMKAKKELAESKIQLDAYTKKASELESSGKASATEINKLHEKINELTHRHSGILAKGKELYDAIETGETTVHWSKDDFINYLEYYKMKDLPFVNEMETEYNHLSPKYIFFAILEHEGKSDEDILRIMGISESTLRSTRSRINSKKR